MANDILGFNQETPSKGLISAKGVVLQLGGSELKFAQNFNLQYGTSFTPTPVIGSATVYYTSGIPSGSASISNVIGSDAVLADTGDSCQTSFAVSLKNTEECFGSGSSVAGSGMLVADPAFVTSVGLSAQAGQGVITDSIQMQFSKLMRG